MAEQNVIWSPHPGSQTLFLPCPADEALISGNRGGGKSQPLDSLVLTPSGFVQMGSLKVHDVICNPDGTDQEVQGIYPQGTQEVYRLFCADKYTECTLDHLWRVHSNKLNETIVVTTKHLIDTISDGYLIAVYKGIGRSRFTEVTSIESTGQSKECQCIKVSSENSLYITDNFIVTHNTDVLLMDFLQHVGQGFGSEWRGILFREEYTQLTDIINKSLKWISQIFPGAKYNGSEHKWTFPEGEQLYLRYMRVPSDYWNYHGHEYPWIGFEELTNWATDECYKLMMSCNRSSNIDVPRKYRASCNPSGPGHGWVKQRFIDIGPSLKMYTDPESGKTRVNIPSSLKENSTLLEADPTYEQTILAAAADDPVKYKAWVLGEWDIIAGGALTDVWDPKMQVLPHFQIPRSWKIHRSFDWGSTSPWGVTYGAECNGEQPDSDYDIPEIPVGSIIIIDEIYGWTGKVNEGDQAVSQEIAERTLAKDRALELEYNSRVYNGPADTSIYEVRDGTSIGANLAKHGCHWTRAYKGSGSRVSGLALIRTMLAASKRWDLEKPGLYFFDRARHHIRTFPLLQYDEKKTEDVDTRQEDHCYDSCRYLLTRKLSKMKRRRVRN